MSRAALELSAGRKMPADHEFDMPGLKIELDVLNIAYDYNDDAVLDKLVELCICNGLYIVPEWVAFSTTKMLNIDNLEHFEHERFSGVEVKVWKNGNTPVSKILHEFDMPGLKIELDRLNIAYDYNDDAVLDKLVELCICNGLYIVPEWVAFSTTKMLNIDNLEHFEHERCSGVEVKVWKNGNTPVSKILHEFDIPGLKIELDRLNIAYDYNDDAVLDKLVELCICNGLYIVPEWVAFSTTKMLNIDNLEHFEHERFSGVEVKVWKNGNTPVSKILHEFDIPGLKIELDRLNIAYDYNDDAVLDKLVQLCIRNGLPAEDIVPEWVAFSTTKMLNIDNLKHFEHEVLNKKHTVRSLQKLEPVQENLLDSSSTPAKTSGSQTFSFQGPPNVGDTGHFKTECYTLSRNPRGRCLIINNEIFGIDKRNGTQKDQEALEKVFSKLGFKVEVHHNMKASDIRCVLGDLGKQDFTEEDALVVCVLSHGKEGCVLGTDGEMVLLRELKQPFTSESAPTLAGKPKLFFIQACQGSCLQWVSKFEEDSVCSVSTASHADFLMGMAAVEEFKTLRNVETGAVYTQELCRQLEAGAVRGEDIHSVLTAVHREVGKGEYSSHKYKLMPEFRSSLTKKLVLDFI